MSTDGYAWMNANDKETSHLETRTCLCMLPVLESSDSSTEKHYYYMETLYNKDWNLKSPKGLGTEEHG